MKVDIIRDSERWLKEEITINSFEDLRHLYDLCTYLDFRFNEAGHIYEAILHDMY